MSLDSVAIVDALMSRALATGYVERADSAEPTGTAGQGVTCAVVLREWAPAQRRSGLATTSLRVAFDVQLYAPMADPRASAVDALLWAANDALITAYSADFNLGGAVDDVDLLGAYGTPLSGRLGYTRMAGDALYRVLTITVPVIVNDVYTQVA